MVICFILNFRFSRNGWATPLVENMESLYRIIDSSERSRIQYRVIFSRNLANRPDPSLILQFWVELLLYIFILCYVKMLDEVHLLSELMVHYCICLATNTDNLLLSFHNLTTTIGG
ncbi:hypothetical protein EB796_021317 [Bugula neritina]|uniref:Uncharacterized protein n=1 Tax=Bugula neritina TaxID=10212 RepID=A0A7J7J2M5_BUGNE|nr:hypothetical protein EB796_021317 [Bugula neritina]